MYEAIRSGATRAVMLDSSLLVAYFHPRDENHADARTFFEGIRDEKIRARPLYTSEYVVDETATTLRGRATHDRAMQALEFLESSSQVRVLHVDRGIYARAVEQFGDYDDQTASFTDHVIAIQARENDIGYVVSFDGDFEPFELVTLPRSR